MCFLSEYCITVWIPLGKNVNDKTDNYFVYEDIFKSLKNHNILLIANLLKFLRLFMIILFPCYSYN